MIFNHLPSGNSLPLFAFITPQGKFRFAGKTKICFLHNVISTALPNIVTYTKEQPQPADNVLIFSHTTEKYFYPEHKTPYLFLSNMINKGHYTLNKNSIQASQKNFYFLNLNDNLEINFSNSLPLKTLFIMFTEQFIRDSFYCSVNSDETLLDSPRKTFSGQIEFPGVPFEFSGIIKARIAKLLHNKLDKEETGQLLFELLYDIFSLNSETKQRITKIDAVKKSTKEELYRRLYNATELMNDMVCEDLSIDQIAKEVCMNKFHFLTTFKSLYTTTPYQYYKKLKLQKAYELLQQDNLSVIEICYAIGFESVGSFSNSFRKQFNISPSMLQGRH